MKKTTKVLLLLLCAVMLVAGSVMGTLAFLTSQDAVTNTFTVGNVQINLDEANVATSDPDDRTETGNEYHLLPGQTYVKDPTVTILEGSEESYVRMLVKVTNYSNLKAAFPEAKHPTFYDGDNFLLQNLVTGWDDTTWVSTKVIAVTDDVATYEFRYKETVAGPVENNDEIVDGTKLDALFDEIVIPDSVNNTELANLKNVQIHVEAQAIQAAGFEITGADGAWAAFAK